jgi:hypothetical protein
MIISPDRNIPRARFLMPIKDNEWKKPSQGQQKTFCGEEDHTFFRIRARMNDGHVAWTGWFEDREDFDAFLFAIANGSLRYERALWKLPNVEWHPGIGESLSYDFLTQTILTTTGSNQTYTSPSDWDNSSNQVECLGGGGSGGASRNLIHHTTGGGAGAYSLITNFNFASPGVTTATYNIGIGGAVRSPGSGSTSGDNGGPTWWNDTVDPGNGTDNTKCSAARGNGGVSGTGSRNGGAGGATTAGWGQTKYAGGAGGNLTGASGSGASGGGGAAGPSGNGGAGGSSANQGSNIQTAGGSANNGTTSGGAAGGTNGGSGTEFSGSYGCGSGGGGRSASSGSTLTAGSGGNYGGGGGGVNNTSSSTVNSGAGQQGLIIVEYTPFVASGSFSNMPMLGL